MQEYRKTIRRLICKLTGHHYDRSRFQLLQTQNTARDRVRFLGQTVLCPVCGRTWTIGKRGIKIESAL